MVETVVTTITAEAEEKKSLSRDYIECVNKLEEVLIDSLISHCNGLHIFASYTQYQWYLFFDKQEQNKYLFD